MANKYVLIAMLDGDALTVVNIFSAAAQGDYELLHGELVAYFTVVRATSVSRFGEGT
jgi:hypothetical protein